MQINQSKEKANIPQVKVSLLVLYVPRNGSLIQKVWKTCFSNKSDSKTHGVMLGKKKESTSVWLRATNCSATHSDMTLCSWLTGPCHRHILPSNGLVRCTYSRPACCVCFTSLYHLSDTVRVRNRRSSIHLVPTWFVAFHLAKTAA